MTSNRKIFTLLLFIFMVGLISGCSLMQDRRIRDINKILQSGNDAFVNKHYDKAIEYYDSGLAIFPKEPVFLSNKSAALRNRGIERYNSSIRITDQNARLAGIDASKNDFLEAAAVSTEAVNQIKSISSAESLILESLENTKLNTFTNHAETMRLCATIADKSKAVDALKAAHEYFALETNQEKKLQVQLNIGKMLIDTNNGEKAIDEFQNILDFDPNQSEALFGMGLALSQSGLDDDLLKAKPYLEKFVNRNPDNNQSVKIAKEILSSMPSKK